MATEQQIPKLVAGFVEHQKQFFLLSNEDAQWAINNMKQAVALACEAIKNRGQYSAFVRPVGPPELARRWKRSGDEVIDLKPQVVACDSIIRIDRSTPSTYPMWVRKVIHPELGTLGPAEFDVSKLDQWLHPGQVNGEVAGPVIFTYLERAEILSYHLCLRDLKEIKKRGGPFFRRYFRGKAIYGWRSAVEDVHGHVKIPYLVENSNAQEIQNWGLLAGNWNAARPALRYG